MPNQAEATVGDEDKLAAWLAEHVCPEELSDDRLCEALVARCRAEQLEPPAPSRVERVIGTARAAFDQRFTTEVASRLTGPVAAGLEAFVAEADETGFLAELKADPAKPGIETLLAEIDKLARVGQGGQGPHRALPGLVQGGAVAAHGRPTGQGSERFLFESSWKKPYSTRGVRALLARYANLAGLEHNMPPHRLRHFLFTWLKTQGIDDALIQPYSGHASRTGRASRGVTGWWR